MADQLKASQIRLELGEENPEAIMFDGLDAALVGIARRHTKKPLALYSKASIIAIFRKRDGMSSEDAEEFFEFNVRCLWAGPGTPLILEDC